MKTFSIRKLVMFLVWLCGACSFATSYNIAPKAKITTSSEQADRPAANIADGIIHIADKGEWASGAQQMFWGEADHPWVKLEWDEPVTVNRVVVFDRACKESHTASVTLTFSDGSRVDIGRIPENGDARSVEFEPRTTTFIKLQITDSDGSYPGLSEVEVYPSPSNVSDLVELVDPYIETTRGRYFFFSTGSLPMGMMSAAPMTRNKNQGGGGYNYNDSYILGFSQIHAWMLSGLSVMPASGATDYGKGEQHWKSKFSHESEIVRPGYHRVYLDKYGAWVEQTVTERTSLYRMTYVEDAAAAILLNLGGYLGTSTMVNAKVNQDSPTSLSGSFDTTGRLWGGPDIVTIHFVAEFNRPFTRLDSWDSETVNRNITSFHSTGKSVARNEGMSYHDAPTAGVAPVFDLKKGEELLMKVAISYVSTDNARLNLKEENPGWDFEATCHAAYQVWNEWLGRITVEGGSDAQRVKFYTDMWHTLLGRHKIDDINGQYPDRTNGRIDGRHTFCDNWKVGQIALDKSGKPKHHIYNSDALWLTQWNQNTLWGLAYPDLLDDFCASLLEYAYHGKLLPRGPCGGSYSFIMSGCPATSMITSAYQRGINHKWNAKKAYPVLVYNHERGGMLGYNFENEFDFYCSHGYAPEKAGLTVQWAFEDWALSEMAEAMGKKKDALRYRTRSQGWRQCVHPDLKLLMPKKTDGTWLHTNPLSGWGYEEANAWQTTFGLSNDIPGLAEAMGGSDTFCHMLNFALEKSVEQDFVGGYGNGYVSYANQPGLSTAHVFSHAGKPWLTQYWVRRVNEQAYGDINPYRGYGGHDEDQGQMSGVSALMSIGLFSINGGSVRNPYYEITSPVFDAVTIKLHPEYYKGETFRIIAHNVSDSNCYIKEAKLNGVPYSDFRLPHNQFANGGTLELWLSPEADYSWGCEAFK